MNEIVLSRWLVLAQPLEFLRFDDEAGAHLFGAFARREIEPLRKYLVFFSHLEELLAGHHSLLDDLDPFLRVGVDGRSHHLGRNLSGFDEDDAFGRVSGRQEHHDRESEDSQRRRRNEEKQQAAPKNDQRVFETELVAHTPLPRRVGGLRTSNALNGACLQVVRPTLMSRL